MLGQFLGGRNSGSPSGSRLFRYEVEGLRQNAQTDQSEYPIRSSASIFITVPYERMNQEMQRITQMGGKIVNIEAVNFDPACAADREG
ncbi:MAG: photosystem I reaction center subunit XII [Leptolyngbyaceae cyanobacterium SM1_1_3]|nr:photosystem I reaction center subunit XII [Leptolyngbyaceae cyanobacterium SM1_1_3]NJM84766.1 photosystem I reaction center subunit XII [Leptolyngbyaceae cyanobacterium RM2_2_21]NJN04567.1 photosystem I reaction center subunit XII [Leptolyngbyaceae cyanobacterium RM1_1_2]NJO11669.1 photosystem I reaction center subunit XII [Leptolyngbyaceae cyanobacterium SL_1_1]